MDVAVWRLVRIALHVGILDPQLFDVVWDTKHGLPSPPEPEGQGWLKTHHEHCLVVFMINDLELFTVDRTDFRAPSFMRELEVGSGQYTVDPSCAAFQRWVSLETSSLEVGIGSAWSTAEGVGETQQ